MTDRMLIRKMVRELDTVFSLRENPEPGGCSGKEGGGPLGSFLTPEAICYRQSPGQLGKE